MMNTNPSVISARENAKNQFVREKREKKGAIEMTLPGLWSREKIKLKIWYFSRKGWWQEVGIFISTDSREKLPD